MSCFNPNLMRCRTDLDTGRLYYTFLGSARYSDPHKLGSYFDLSKDNSFEFLTPCGRCLGCRIDYTRDWTNRMCFELVDNEYKAIFVTLTYNNDHVPVCEDGFTLKKSDVQLFFKRLRKYFTGKRIRYYLCGEYGSRTFRPHYHAIIFGLSLSDFDDLRQIGYNELKNPYFTSDIFSKIWANGFTLLSEVNYKTCSYVARYVTKKHYGCSISDLGSRVQEFNLSSRNPGIGFSHAVDYVLSGNFWFDFPFSDGVHTLSLPKSFIRHVRRIQDLIPDFDLDKFMEVCYSRSRDANDRLLSNLSFYSLPFSSYLDQCSDSLFRKLRVLPDRNI